MFTTFVFAQGSMPSGLDWISSFGGIALTVMGAAVVFVWLSLRYIPHNSVGVVEKLWSASGSVPEGRLLALDGEAGFQAELLRGGLHFGLWRFQYRLHKVPLVTIRQGRIGYVYARDGEALPPSQTLGRIVECNNFQDARAFLANAGARAPGALGGQRGRQRSILREGVYAINPALFVVMTEDAVFSLRGLQGPQEVKAISDWQKVLSDIGGFSLAVKLRVEDKSLPQADLLALVGDAADGYPGIPGIGAKTAAQLLNRYGPIEKFPSNVLGEQRDLALLFKNLATLRTDAPLFKKVETLRWRGATPAFAAWADRMEAPRLLERCDRVKLRHAASKAAGR
jgi:hypothetical protein